MKKVFTIILCLFPILFSSCRMIPSGLPAGAVQMAEGKTLLVYVAANGHAVWSMRKADHQCRCLLDSAACDWIPVEGVYLLKEDPLFLLLEGKPDLRNVYSRIWKEDADSLIMLPTNAGLIGISEEEELLIMQSYDYYRIGGRYNRIDAYDMNGRLLGTMSPKLTPEWDMDID